MMHRPARGAAAGVLLAVLAAFPLQAPADPAADARALVRGGQEALLREDTARAVELFRAALAVNPAYLDALVGLAEVFFTMEEYDEALRYVEQARRFDGRSLQLRILEGRTCIALSRLERAAVLFGEVLEREPNNLPARFGLAELDIASGKRSAAVSRYMESLRYAPENRTALLSLAELREAEGDMGEAQRYLELALRLHSGDPGVQLAAGLFARRRGRYAQAERHLRTAISLRESFPRARQALAEVQLSQGRAPDAIAGLRQMLAENRGDAVTWYLLGLAYDVNGEAEGAVRSLAEAVRLRPDDEIARVALEDVIRRRTKADDPVRQRYAAWHLERGRMLEERNFLDKALFEYRRGLLLDPLSASGQYTFARIYLTRGYPVMYLDKLRMMEEKGMTRVQAPEEGRVRTINVTDEIEILASETEERLSLEWNVDQYSLEGFGPRESFSLSVYTLSERNSTLHRAAGELLTRYWIEALQRSENLSIREQPTAVAAFDEAFRRARANGSDYFVLFALEETERSITVRADLHLARTGALLHSERVFRTGNDRVRDAVLILADRVESLFPMHGRLLKRRFGLGILDQGRMAGLEEGRRLLILRKGSLQLDHERVGFLYRPEDVLGRFEITRTDEKLAEGRVLKAGFFDRINAGDEIIAAPEEPGGRSSGRAERAGDGQGARTGLDAPAGGPGEVDGNPGLLRRIYRAVGL